MLITAALQVVCMWSNTYSQTLSFLEQDTCWLLWKIGFEAGSLEKRITLTQAVFSQPTLIKCLM